MPKEEVLEMAEWAFRHQLGTLMLQVGRNAGQLGSRTRCAWSGHAEHAAGRGALGTLRVGLGKLSMLQGGVR